MEELGFPGFDATAWFGLMGPSGLPRPIVDKLNAETVKVLAQPDVRAKLEGLGRAIGRQHARAVRRDRQSRAADVGQGSQRRWNQDASITFKRSQREEHMVRAWLVVFASILSLVSASAQSDYPDKPVRFIVGFTAGSATDITARIFAQKFSEAWGVPVTVENVPGAGGSVGGDRVAKSAPDGTTFYWGANGALAINPTLLASQQTYDVVRDLTPVARLLIMPSILGDQQRRAGQKASRRADRARKGATRQAVLCEPRRRHAAAHRRPKCLGARPALDIVHVPYRGTVFTDVVGGRVTIRCRMSGTILPVVQQKQLRALAITSLKQLVGDT